MPRVERQHTLIEELRVKAPRHVTGKGLARSLGVNIRTIERDIARLQEAGVPIDVKRGPRGGYSIDARAKLPPLEFTPGEAAALIASLVTLGPYATAYSQSALAKLLESLTPEGSHPKRVL